TPLIARRSIPSITSTTNRARCFSGSHSSTDGGRRNPVWRSIVRKLFIGATFAAMENHRTDSIPNDSYPVKSDRLLGQSWFAGDHRVHRFWRSPHIGCGWKLLQKLQLRPAEQRHVRTGLSVAQQRAKPSYQNLMQLMPFRVSRPRVFQILENFLKLLHGTASSAL